MQENVEDRFSTSRTCGRNKSKKEVRETSYRNQGVKEDSFSRKPMT